MTGRTRKSPTTPDPTPKQVEAFHALITPAVRRGGDHVLMSMERPLVGDVLDTEPNPPCWIRTRSYSEKKQRACIFWKSCGRRSCPVCVTDWAAEKVAPSWAYWQGRASWIVMDDKNAERRWRHVSNIRVQGAEADPGVLSLPIRYGDQRAVFFPSDEALDPAVIVHAVRVLPVTVPEAVKRQADAGPNLYYGTIPGYIRDTAIREAAKAAGFQYRGGSRVWSANNVTPEQNAIHLGLLW